MSLCVLMRVRSDIGAGQPVGLISTRIDVVLAKRKAEKG